MVTLVRALYNYKADTPANLSFSQGDLIQVFAQLESGWWDGLCRQRRGWFPSNYVESVILRSQAEEQAWVTRKAATVSDSKSLALQNGEKRASWYWYNDLTGESLWNDERQEELHNKKVVVLQAPWIIYVTEDGSDEYFLNEDTEELSWTLPSEMWDKPDDNNIKERHSMTEAPERGSSSLRHLSEVPTALSIAVEGTGSLPDDGDDNSSTHRSSKTQSVRMQKKSEELPAHWNKKLTPQGRTYYYSVLTDETTYSLGDIDYVTGRLKSKSTNNTQPPSPSSVLMIENQTQRRPSNLSLRLQELQLSPSVSVHSLNLDGASSPTTPVDFRSKHGQLRQQMRAWSMLTQQVLSSINKLKQSIKAVHKQDYIVNSSVIVDAIRNLLIATSTVDKETPVVRNSSSVQQHHRRLLKALSTLVLTAKSASGMWPPPDATQNMMNASNELLTSIRSFIDIIREAGVQIDYDQIPGFKDENKATSASASPTVAHTPRIAASPKHSNPPSGFTSPVQDRRLSISSNLKSGIMTRLDSSSKTVIRTLDALNDDVSQQFQSLNSRRSSKNNSSTVPPSISPSVIIAQTRQAVTEIGQFLALIEDTSLDDTSSTSHQQLPSASPTPLLQDFRIHKQALYNNITALVMATQIASDSSHNMSGSSSHPSIAQLNAYEQLQLSISVVQKSIRDLLISTKWLAESKNNVRASLVMVHRQSISDVSQTMVPRTGAVTRQPSHEVLANDHSKKLPRGSIGSARSQLSPRSPRRLSFALPLEHVESSTVGQPPSSPNNATKYNYQSGIFARRDTTGQNGVNQFTVDTELANMHANNIYVNSSHQESSPEKVSIPRPSSPAKTLRSAKLKKFFGDDIDSAIAVSGTASTRSTEDTSSDSSRHSKPISTTSPRTPITATSQYMSTMLESGASLGASPFVHSTGSGTVVGRRDERPWYLRNDYQPYEILYNMEGQIKGGTLEALVERLTLHDEYDSNFTTNFLCSYRSFTTALELFTLLTHRFTIFPPDGLNEEETNTWIERRMTPIRLRVFNIMKHWLEYFCIPANADDTKVLDRMQIFARQTMRPVMAAASVQLIKLIDKRRDSPTPAVPLRQIVQPPTPTTPNSGLVHTPPTPILPRSKNKLKFIDLDPLEVARQLTLIEFSIYSQVVYTEYMDKNWSVSSNGNHEQAAALADQRAPNLRRVIDLSNKITTWVADSILSDEDAKKRCSLVKQYVYIADKCRTLNNFNTMFSIVAGLNSGPISRLKRTWDMLSNKTKAMFNGVDKLTQSARNFAEYRDLLHTVSMPCIPFVGRYLSDLTFLEDGNPNNISSPINDANDREVELINFGKRTKIAEVMREIQQFQSTPYNLLPVPTIQDRLLSLLDRNIPYDELWELSLSVEPKEREDQKLVRLLEEGGLL